MRVVVQRVSEAKVSVGGETVATIGRGLLLLVGLREADGLDQLRWMADKVVGLRIFEDGEGRMNLSLPEVEGQLLVVSQFTLYGDARKGRRPSFVEAARPEVAEPLYDQFVGILRESGSSVETGRFGAMMEVSLVNDGPVTLVIDR